MVISAGAHRAPRMDGETTTSGQPTEGNVEQVTVVCRRAQERERAKKEARQLIADMLAVSESRGQGREGAKKRAIKTNLNFLSNIRAAVFVTLSWR